MNMRQARQLEYTAYHEAGHCMASLLLKHRFREVFIIPDKEEKRNAIC